MKGIFHLQWYEWIGWMVNILMIALSAFFVTVSFTGDEVRAALTCLALATILVPAWTWVLLYYGKPRETRSNPQTEH